MSKKPALPAELMAHHLNYRFCGPQAEPRVPQGKSAEALLIVQRIRQRQACEQAIRASAEWEQWRTPSPVWHKAVPYLLPLLSIAAGLFLIVEAWL